MNYELIPS